ncbi:DUF6171 family protein [Bacillus sp. JCM 19034]|uniref:DUF6171 family protein n=1 Tax=Bacillus sp. JCM 19034 TaxID=1481928 RepID=UPI000AE7ED63
MQIDKNEPFDFETSTDAKLVSKKIYEERLLHCKSCTSLLYKSTCQYSGELITYRARFSDKQCPYPHNPKWNKVN